jgi:hypothetical protein
MIYAGILKVNHTSLADAPDRPLLAPESGRPSRFTAQNALLHRSLGRRQTRVVDEEADVVDVDGLEYLELELFRLAYHLAIRRTDIKHK